MLGFVVSAEPFKHAQKSLESYTSVCYAPESPFHKQARSKGEGGRLPAASFLFFQPLPPVEGRRIETSQYSCHHHTMDTPGHHHMLWLCILQINSALSFFKKNTFILSVQHLAISLVGLEFQCSKRGSQRSFSLFSQCSAQFYITYHTISLIRHLCSKLKKALGALMLTHREGIPNCMQYFNGDFTISLYRDNMILAGLFSAFRIISIMAFSFFHSCCHLQRRV